MFTPQQIEQISFGKATFGGYDMNDVDEFLEPLTEDYITLYKENALLKSKMRVLVGKLEEYRKNEAAMKEAVLNAQKTSEKMIREAEAKCAQMLSNANASVAAKAAEAVAVTKAAEDVAETTKKNDALIAAENARVEEARKTANVKINELQEQLRSCIQALDRIKGANAPAAPVAAPAAPAAPVAPAPKADPAFDFDSDAVADEISKSLENLVGTTTDHSPKAAPKHPINDSTTSKFSTLNLQFGRNYDLGK